MNIHTTYRDSPEPTTHTASQLEELAMGVENLSKGQRAIEQTLIRQETILEQIVKTQEMQAQNGIRISLLEQAQRYDDDSMKTVAKDNKDKIDALEKGVMTLKKETEDKAEALRRERKDDLFKIYGFLLTIVGIALALSSHLNWK